MTTQRFLITALAIGACAIPASATLATYSTPTALEAALPSDTFSNITFAQGNLGTSTTDFGIVFSTSSPQLTGILSPSGWVSGTAIDTTFQNQLYTIALSFPAGVNAIGFYVDSQASGSSVSLSVKDSGGTITPSFTESGSTPSFFGVTTTDSTFTSFLVGNDTTNNGADLTLGDVQFGEQAPTPEVATLLLVATGLLAMGFFRRRRLMRTAAGEDRPQGCAAASTNHSASALRDAICAGY